MALAIGTIFGAGAFLLLKPDLFRAAIGMVYRIYVWAGAHHRGRGSRARRRAQAVRLALPTEGRGAL